jgi:hypothetical protein
MLTGALLCVAALFIFMACEKDEAKAPGAAGNITGAIANVCPDVTVDLTIAAIENATAYQWYKDGTAIATGQSYTVTASGTYTVAGKNNEGEGAKSPAHVVTISGCSPAGVGTITAAPQVCAAGAGSVELTVAPIEGATAYQWYKDATAIPDATAQTYTATEDGTYAVAGVNADGEGGKSEEYVVTIASCALGAAGEITGVRADCPDDYMILSIEPIENAVEYQWYTVILWSGAYSEVEKTTEPVYHATVGGAYAVAGLDDALEAGVKSPTYNVILDPCKPATPAVVAATGVSSGSSVTSCTLGATTVTLTGKLSARATSYTWYITKTLNAAPEKLTTYAYVNSTASLTYTATQTGTYTTVGVNEHGESDPSPGFYFEVSDLSNCPTPDDIGAISVNASFGTLNGSVYNNICNANNTNNYVRITWTAAANATSYTVTNKTTSTTYSVAANTLYYNAAESGSYTVQAKNFKGEGAVSTNEIVVDIVECPLPKPAFDVIPAGNLCPSTVTEASVYTVTGASSYVWYKDGTASGTVTTLTYEITSSGTYKVRAISATGMEGSFSDEISVTIGNCFNVSARNDVVGTYDAKDQKPNPMIAGMWSDNEYTLTISAGIGANDININGLGNTGAGGATVTATIDFTSANTATGVYGTVTIPEQDITTYGGAAVTDIKFGKYVYNWGTATYGGGYAVTADIVILSGKLRLRFNSSNRYAIFAGTNDAKAQSPAETYFTKQ